MYAVTAQFMPGNTSTQTFSTRKAAVAAAREANRKPWNRSANAALVVSPSGKGTRNY